MYDSFSVAPKRIFPSQVKWANFLSPPLFNSHTFSPLLSEKVNLYNTHIPRIATFANTLKKNHQMAFYSIFSNGEKFCREKIKRLSGAVMDEEDVYKDAGAINGLSRPLSAIAEAFEKLSDSVKAANGSDLRLEPFCDACSLVSVLFGCLGVAFKFAEMEYVSKVRDLSEASTIYGTLNKIVDYDVKNDTVKTQGSLTRNLRRVRQGLDLIRALFQNFLSTDECSLKDAASTAYAQVCAPYHTWAVRTAVSAGMCALPTRDQLLLKLNETDESAEKEMGRYIKASIPVIKYIDNLYISRNITLDW